MDIKISNREAGRIVILLRADVAPKTVGKLVLIFHTCLLLEREQ